MKNGQATVQPVQGLRVKAKTTLNVRNGPDINYIDIGIWRARK